MNKQELPNSLNPVSHTRQEAIKTLEHIMSSHFIQKEITGEHLVKSTIPQEYRDSVYNFCCKLPTGKNFYRRTPGTHLYALLNYIKNDILKMDDPTWDEFQKEFASIFGIYAEVNITPREIPISDTGVHIIGYDPVGSIQRIMNWGSLPVNNQAAGGLGR